MRRGAGRAALAAVALLAGGCANLPPVRVTAADAARPIELAKGQDLYVSLPANSTTGYAWSAPLKPDAVLALVEAPLYTPAPSGGALGRGGTQTFWFRAVTRGRQKLRLLYRRAAERPVDVRIFTVRVR